MFEFALKWKFGNFVLEIKYILGKKMRTMNYWTKYIIGIQELNASKDKI